MSSPNESSSSKRRVGRRRLPPLEPGPVLQFVVANHPDQFRAGKTMRHVRSHVMYQHRIERKTTSSDKTNTDLPRSTSACASETPSPIVPNSEASADVDYLVAPQSRPRSSTWTGVPPKYIAYAPLPSTLRSLTYRILSSAQGAFARSAPPIFEDALTFPFPGLYGTHSDPLDGLKQHYINSSSFFCQDRQWMRAICADPMSFLSHVSVSCVYQDLADGLWQDSDTTMHAKTHVLSMIAGRLETNDATILSILHLLLIEAGGGDESAFKVHYEGLQGLVQRRGGMSQLPHQLATYVTVYMTTLAILKGLPELGASPASGLGSHNTRESYPYISPLYAPQGIFAQLRASCSTQTLDVVDDMYRLTQAFSNQNTNRMAMDSSRYNHHIPEHLLHETSTQKTATPDWVYESVRLAALIYTHAILHQTTFAESANTRYQDINTGSVTLLCALLGAVEHTDTTNCWEDMRGVFLWVCLIGGAASGISGESEGIQQVAPPIAWARKCFSLWAIKAVVSVGFEHAEGLMETLRTGLRVRHMLDGEDR